MSVRLLERLLAWTEAPTVGVALRRLAAYAALRLWVLIIACFPIEMNLRTARLMGRIWWALTYLPTDRLPWFLRFLRRLSCERHRERALDNLRPALGADYDEAGLRRIARASFEHFAQLYLVEAALTPRVITTWSWARHVELGEGLGAGLELLLARRGVIMLTPHFGNYELLGFTLCRLGIPITAVMRPLDNPLINEYLVRSREASGLTLLYKKGAMVAAPQVLADGGALCFIADQDAGRKGLFVEFFGRKASTYKSIGLLAMQQRTPIVVGCAARTRRGFHYRIEIERIIQPEEWANQDDPLYWITQTFSHALEASIRRHPEQYLWMHRRWKHRPKDEQPAST